jgi:hypothetical protein
MDEQLHCPDCHADHLEPAEAVLGHLARCLACALAADVELAEQALAPKVVRANLIGLRTAA